MAKKNNIKKMECKEDGVTDFFTIYSSNASKKNSGSSEKLSLKRYNPRLRKHCIYTETKLK